jgi:predicted ATPase/transcriptional regulator with XRE-family HTH domain
MSNGTPFGLWLKSRRREVGLTQKDLASRIGCSTVLVEKLESGERRPSEQIATLLADFLDIAPEEQRAFIDFARGIVPTSGRAGTGSGAPWVASRRRASNLPAQRTAFVGREKVVAGASELLRRPDVRLLTLTGAPGIGKTRLSLEIAARLAADFTDGVYFVALASLRDPNLFLPTVGQVLGLRETGNRRLADTLNGYLRDRALLLVLDNFEQVIPAALLVSDLLAASPALKVLATSREILHLYGEHDFPVPPMDVPDPEAQPGESLAECDAVRLFYERAASVAPPTPLSSNDLEVVARICSRLDGLPLAIELAAARTRHLTIYDILSHLDSKLALLVGGPVDLPPRQRTLRGAIDWSYELLDESERTLFRRLSVFAGGCTAQAVEAICQVRDAERGTWEDLTTVPRFSEVLASLVDKSLLRHDESLAEPRFSMLETIREYAGERLAESGEVAGLQQQHAAYYLSLAEEAQPELKGAHQLEWVERLEAEHDNLRAALATSLASEDSATALRLCTALSRFWHMRGYLSEGVDWIAAALAADANLDPARRATLAVRAQALNSAGSLTWGRGDYSSALDFYGQSLTLSRELGDRAGMSRALNNLAVVAHDTGDYARSRDLYTESLALKRELGDKWGIAASLNGLGVVEQDQGNYDEARTLMSDALVIWREVGDKVGIASTLNNIGILVLMQGDYSAAQALYEESLDLRNELGDRQGASGVLHNLAEVAWCQGDYGRARALGEESLGMRRDLGDSHGVASSLHNLAHALHHQGHTAQATELLMESLSIFQELGDRPGIAACLTAFAAVASTEGQMTRAATLFGAADALLETTGFHLHPADRIEQDRAAPLVRQALGEGEWRTAWEMGRAMTPERAIAFAIDNN